MNDRLHEIIAKIGIIHRNLIASKKINDVDYVLNYIENVDVDIKEHYLKLLLQYYFQENLIENFKRILLLGYHFDLRMDDLKLAFCNIKSNSENVIEFLEDNIVYFKDTNYEEPLKGIFEYYQNASEELKVSLEESLEIIRRNRFICAYSYKNKQYDFANFFINDDLLESLKRDLPHLLK